MVYTITRHPLFETDLRDIHRLVEDYAGTDIADRKVIEIVRFVEGLRDFPKIGTVRQDTLAGMRAIPASDKAIVCFTVNDLTMTVFILGVSYAGSDWQTQMAKR